MTNPKVFEFAKEVGMTPLALMDKIKEWQLPIKSHMAELEPEILEQLKQKINQSGKPDEAKKKTATRKAPAKKAATLSTAATATKSGAAVRRKSTAEEPPPVATTTVIRKKAVAEEPPPIEKEEIVAAPEVEVVPEVETPPAAASPVAPVLPTVVAAPVVEEKIVESKPVLARKKEVTVGTSGVASDATPVSTVGRRNIIGRMDLSRVQQPAGSGPGQRPMGPGARRPPTSGTTGFGGGPARAGAANRNIRAGFVAAAPMTDVFDPELESDYAKGKKFPDKKNKKLESNVASAKEKETEEVENFNAVEFRKREMVFQPRKKKGLLNRASMQTQITQPKASKRIVKVYGSMKVSDLATEMGIKAAQIIKNLVQNGMTATMNTDLDFDTIALIIPEFGWEAQNVEKSAEDIIVENAQQESAEDLVTRPPVVAVMGHVDHGKTSLLDAIRKTDVASGEAGGITQHIGAYSVKLEDGSLITFLDTPGHEAFTAMRARGANVTDIAIIVVAADDGAMPQTAEAINHARAANVPIIVAVNKIDKPGANIDKIKQQLTEYQLVPEEWGGSTIYAPVSALKKTGVKELLEQIKLVAEMQELKANPKKPATGVVIEAKVEKGKGSVATLLVKDGTVKVGQSIVAGSMKGRVRSLTNDKGERVNEVGPGMPVEIQGLDGTPKAGDRFDSVKDEATAEKVAQLRKDKESKDSGSDPKKLSLEDLFSKVNKGDVKELSLVLKADVQGSLEALQGMLNKASTVEVKTKLIHTAVGGINESDVLLAHTAKGIVLGFNVRPDGGAQAKAKQLGVEIRTYSIIYELIDDIKKAMGGLLTPDVVEKVMGRAEVRNTFTVPKIGTIAGCFVTDGKVMRSNLARLLRDGKIIYEGKISSLKRFKDDAREVASGFECGIGIENFNDVKVGDVIEAFTKEEVARELTANAEA